MTDEMMEPSLSDSSGAPSVASEEVDSHALQVTSTAAEVVGHEPQAGTRVRAGDAGGHGSPRTRREAQATLRYTAAYCGNCPIRERCVEEACAIWRAEKVALGVLRRTQVVAGVPLRGSVV